jgi:hypothetical protein
MPELGEGIAAAIIKQFSDKFLFAAIASVTFESGIKIFDVESGGAEKAVPPVGKPHWGAAKAYPAAYVRQGGTGETKDLKVKVKWNQKGFDGAAKLKGTSDDGKIEIKGDFNLSGLRGDATVSCQFSRKPDVVANYGKGTGIKWTVEAGGQTKKATGGSPLRLFFLDAKPKPIGWGYKKHYLKVIDWATTWAGGKQTSGAVFKALWDKFSDGKGARVPHVTGFSYWMTDDPVQDLKTLITPGGPVLKKGWSCRAIAHLFMECLALHGIECLEVVPEAPPTALMFLVQNWDRRNTPFPNWQQYSDVYYGGSWVSSAKPPLNSSVPTSLKKEVIAFGPPDLLGIPPIAQSEEPIKIDLKKVSGVSAQGQLQAPLGFSNHWIVEVGGALYDTSYGAKHVNNINQYAKGALAGWLVATKKDSYRGGFLWLTTRDSRAWQCHSLPYHNLLRNNGDQN